MPTVAGDFQVALAASRSRERAQRTTLVGPHRDDLVLRVNGRAAGPYTSEGQKRSVAIALKMAQAEHLAQAVGREQCAFDRGDDLLGARGRQHRVRQTDGEDLIGSKGGVEFAGLMVGVDDVV